MGAHYYTGLSRVHHMSTHPVRWALGDTDEGRARRAQLSPRFGPSHLNLATVHNGLQGLAENTGFAVLLHGASAFHFLLYIVIVSLTLTLCSLSLQLKHPIFICCHHFITILPAAQRPMTLTLVYLIDHI